ncbi:origin of replication complex subunit 4-like [Lolium rigidum]|uniref:origin of replication complex subunit 4-like n=1 Tax=Lolium rigidum TaxID=89674 RepID=UPI001F5CA988|nr:origin of replication complex subunit 4-like [Lolium rigidum]
MAADGRSPRDGNQLEILRYYNPPPGQFFLPPHDFQPICSIPCWIQREKPRPPHSLPRRRPSHPQAQRRISSVARLHPYRIALPEAWNEGARPAARNPSPSSLPDRPLCVLAASWDGPSLNLGLNPKKACQLEILVNAYFTVVDGRKMHNKGRTVSWVVDSEEYALTDLLDDYRLMEHLLMLDKDSSLPKNYVTEYNSRLTSIFGNKKFKGILGSLTDADATTSNILRFLFRVVSYMDMESGLLSMECFTHALSCMQRQPKLDSLQDLSILELYILVCMNRLEDKEQNSYNFNSIMKEYRSIQDAYKTSDKYASAVCFRAFEHLLDRELITFADSKGRNVALEYRPVKLLISSRELAQSLELNTTCPAVLQKLLDRERYM